MERLLNKAYDVNVRAIVTVGRGSGRIAKSWPWEIYDHCGNVVRCDTLVSVRAGSAEEAIAEAIAEAPPLQGIGYSIDDAELWVDAGIDVTEVS